MSYYKHDWQYKEYNQPVNDILLTLDECFMVSYEQNEENERDNKWKVSNFDQMQVKYYRCYKCKFQCID